MNKIAIIVGGVVLILIGGLVFFTMTGDPAPAPVTAPKTPEAKIEDRAQIEETPEEVVPEEPARPDKEVIGSSAGGQPIIAYTYGTGPRELLLVLGIHGGYAWNTALLGYELNDFLATEATDLDGVRVTIIPVLNPDGLRAVTGTTERFTRANVNPSEQVQIAGRFNANRVDLNRNFDCEWRATGVWRNTEVSGGTAPFSEPEAVALRDYIEKHRPAAVIAYFSAAGGVYASNCQGNVLPETLTLLGTYGTASGYPQHEEYAYYTLTGDLVNWLAQERIPAISVVLTDRTNTELARNRAGLEAVISALQN